MNYEKDNVFDKVIDWMQRAKKNEAVLMKPYDYMYCTVKLLLKYLDYKDAHKLFKSFSFLREDIK